MTHALKLEQLTNSYDFDGTMNVTYYVAGTAYTYNGNVNIDGKGNAGYTITIKSGTTVVNHNTTTGDASFVISCSGTCNSGGWGPGNISLQSTTIKAPRIPLYTLSMSAGAGSSITVNRTACGGGGGTGNLSAGANKLYYGDKLKITFTPGSNYSVTTHTVNNKSFISGNTHTVSGNVSITATATPLKSLVGATDANIGSNTTITITRYNSSYKHTLTYKFGDLTGTIVTKTSDTSIAWTVPTTFYAKIPNDPSGTCTITCTTYNGDASLGSNACTLTVTAAKDINRPIISGTVVDTNATTKALTGNSSILIKNKSIALCTLTATPKNSATISGVKIGGASVTGSTSNGAVTATKTYNNVSATSFAFYAIDSRDYDKTTTVTPTVINYITLSCNPSVYRDTPTSNAISMDVSGNFYKGSFGAYSNTLTLKYRYKQVGESYPSSVQTLEDGSVSDANGWITIDSNLITKGTSSYRSTNTLSLQSYPTTDDSGNTVYLGFDYQIDYEFQIKVYDGASNYVLSTVTKTVNVPKGIPIYDWGENDFNFNVPLMLNNVNIFDIIFPVGAIYTHSSSTIPNVIKNLGTWASVSTGISGVYAWKRTV